MYDVIIVGAGPAGLSAAIICREWDLHVLVIDEFPIAGGRLLGQLHEEPNGKWWNGIEEAKLLVDSARELNTEIMCETSVHHIEKNQNYFSVHTNNGNYESRYLLIATGAAESPIPIPGWTLPGVMSIGAAQVMTNVHRVRIGDKGIIVGINILSAAIARELQLAGTDIHSLFLPPKNSVTNNLAHPKKVMENLAQIAHLAPSRFIRFGSKFAQAHLIQHLVVNFFPTKGMRIWNIPIHLRKAITQINGTNEVESVTVCHITPEGEPIPDTEETIEVDFVCIAGGLYPLTELVAVVGCPFRYIDELGGHVPVHNEKMETPLNGLFVAGNITGIESAQVARAQGVVAGWSIVSKVITKRINIDDKINEAIENVKSIRSTATVQFHPEIKEGRRKIEKEFDNYREKMILKKS